MTIRLTPREAVALRELCGDVGEREASDGREFSAYLRAMNKVWKVSSLWTRFDFGWDDDEN